MASIYACDGRSCAAACLVYFWLWKGDSHCFAQGKRKCFNGCIRRTNKIVDNVIEQCGVY